MAIKICAESIIEKNGRGVEFEAYTDMQYISKLQCAYLYHPTSSVLTLRQRRNICAIQHDHKRKRNIFEIHQYLLLREVVENLVHFTVDRAIVATFPGRPSLGPLHRIG